MSHPPATTTRDLLARYLKGQLQAERRLFRKLKRELLPKVGQQSGWRLIRRNVDAEDVVQEVFLRALTTGALTRLEDRGPGTARRFLEVVLQRTVIDILRRQNAVRRSPTGLTASKSALSLIEDLAADPPDSATTPTGHARAQELVDFVRKHLSDEEWRAWRMVEIDGLSSGEAAERLGTTPSSVRGTLFRARGRLADILRADRQEQGA